MELKDVRVIKQERAEEYDAYIEQNMSDASFRNSEMCMDCIATYREHYINGDLLGEDGKQSSVFPPVCKGDLRKGDGDITKAETDEEMLYAMLHNPELWFKHELGIELRSYQADSASCTSRFKADRWGRRAGKSFHKIGDMLRYMQIGYKDSKTGGVVPMKVLVLTPYQNQIDEIFLELDKLIAGSKTIKNAVDRRRKNPQEMTLTNGSRIIGLCTGGDSGASSDKIRGASGHIIYMDEMDYIPDQHVESVTIIVATAQDSQLWTTTTPSGRRGKFYSICVDKRLRYKERHIMAMMSPEWNKETEQMLRLSYTQAAWEHEVLAVFGVVEGGVFPTNKINSSIRSYAYGLIEDIKDYKTCLGVDWNGAKAGIPIILVGYNQKKNAYVVLDKYVSQETESTQMAGVRDVLMMYDKWKPDFVYLDSGYGGLQFELLRLEAGKRKDEKMLASMKSITMQSLYEIRDPISKTIVKKQTKALMVDLCVQRAEADMLIFPELENIKGQLLDQIREFVVERFTPTGIPVYSQGEEHQLIAWMLAIFGITMEFSDIAKVTGVGAVGYTPVGLGYIPDYLQAIKENKKSNTYDDLEGGRRLIVNGGPPPRVDQKSFARSGSVKTRTMGGRQMTKSSFKGRGSF